MYVCLLFVCVRFTEMAVVCVHSGGDGGVLGVGVYPAAGDRLPARAAVPDDGRHVCARCRLLLPQRMHVRSYRYPIQSISSHKSIRILLTEI